MAAKNIVVDTGLVTYNVEFKDRGITVPIAFNPNDTDMLIRLENAGNNIEKALEEIPKNTDLNDSSAETIKKTNEIIYKQVDYIFGNAISEAVFQFCSPLSVDENGVTFMERFMNAVTPVIKTDIEKANKKAAEKMNKHLEKYKK